MLKIPFSDFETSELSIATSFIEKIHNTTLSEIENLNKKEYNESYLYSPTLDKSNSKAFIPTTLENTINPEIATNHFLNTINTLKSGDVLLLSLSGINDKIIENSSISKTATKTEKTNSHSNSSYKEKIIKIESATEDNKTLLVSEKSGKIYLPYKKAELLDCIEKEPASYNSLQDVVEKEYIRPFKFFKNQSSTARFSETYNLLKNRNGQNFIKSVSFAFKVANKRNLNPIIISACKNKNELESYISCLDTNNLNKFNFFDIIYEVNPL